MAGNIADSLSLLHQTIFEDHQLPHAYLNHPYDYGKNASAELFMLGGGKYDLLYANLTDGQMGMFRLTNEGRLMVDTEVNVVLGQLHVGSTDGINTDSGLRTSAASWRLQSLLWGLDILGAEYAGQVENELINAVPFRPLIIGGSDTLGVPKTLRFNAAGELLTSGSGAFTSRGYTAFTCNPVETAIAHGFSCTELTIMNDGLNTIYYDFVTPVNVLTAHALYAGEAFVDSFSHTDVYFVCAGADTSAVRVWARG